MSAAGCRCSPLECMSIRTEAATTPGNARASHHECGAVRPYARHVAGSTKQRRWRAQTFAVCRTEGAGIASSAAEVFTYDSVCGLFPTYEPVCQYLSHEQSLNQG